MLGGERIQYTDTKKKQQLKDKLFFAVHVWHIYHSSLFVRVGQENSCPVRKAPNWPNQILIGHHSKPPYSTKYHTFKGMLILDIYHSMC